MCFYHENIGAFSLEIKIISRMIFLKNLIENLLDFNRLDTILTINFRHSIKNLICRILLKLINN